MRPVGGVDHRNLGGGAAEIRIKICDFKEQEKGYGKILLSTLIGRLLSMGYGKILPDADLNNTRARNGWERLGFQRVRVRMDSWKNRPGENLVFSGVGLYPERFIGFAG